MSYDPRKEFVGTGDNICPRCGKNPRAVSKFGNTYAHCRPCVREVSNKSNAKKRKSAKQSEMKRLQPELPPNAAMSEVLAILRKLEAKFLP